MISERLYRRFYPDNRLSGTIAFYNWVRESVRPDAVVLNLGAGGATNDPVRCLKGEVACLTGADIDPSVLENSELDEAVVIRGGRLPFTDSKFDVVFSDFVLEHVADPQRFLSEVRRVLKTGRPFFFRTPNRYHYVAAISRMTPHWFHAAVANRARGLPRQAHEPWQAFYLLNNRTVITRHLRRCGFGTIELRMYEAEPMYTRFSSFAFLLGVAYERTVNRWEALAMLRANIFGRAI